MEFFPQPGSTSTSTSNPPTPMPRELPTASLNLHPEASLVPEMPPDQYERFKADIAIRGILTPIELEPGTRTVVEGRTRLKAAGELGLPSVPVTDAELRGDSPVTYMLRAALLRRHLTSSQAAALAVEIEERLAVEAKARQREGGKRGAAIAGRGRPKQAVPPAAIAPTPTPPVLIGSKAGVYFVVVPGFPQAAVDYLAGKGVHTVEDLDAMVSGIRKQRGRGAATRYDALKELNTPIDVLYKAGDALVDWGEDWGGAGEPAPAAKSRDKAAAIAGTNPRYVSDAKKIKKEAPEVFEKVKAGTLTVPEAKRVVAPPKAKDKPAPKDDEVRAVAGDGMWQPSPCPFCGSSSVKMVFGFGVGSKLPMEYGQCQDCHACGPRKPGNASARIAWDQRAKRGGS